MAMAAAMRIFMAQPAEITIDGNTFSGRWTKRGPGCFCCLFSSFS